MTKQRITIIGAGCVGASMGMALRQSASAANLEIIGHDREHSIARRAEKEGAVDKAVFNLDLALRDARLIIIAVPLAELREVLADIGRLLPPDSGVVLTDTTPLKAPALAWAEELLPPGAHFVGGAPFLAPPPLDPAGQAGQHPAWEKPQYVTAARADLLRGAVYAITARPQDHPSAVRAVANLAQVLGATPLYMEPAEHDAVRVLTSALPDMLATALLQTAFADPGWGEMRKAAGHAFAAATAAAAGDAASRRMLALLGREPLLRGLDAMLEQLHALRERVAQGDAETLEQTLHAAAEARAHWLAESRARAWEHEPGAPTYDGVLTQARRALLGGFGLDNTEQ